MLSARLLPCTCKMRPAPKVGQANLSLDLEQKANELSGMMKDLCIRMGNRPAAPQPSEKNRVGITHVGWVLQPHCEESLAICCWM